MVWYVALIVAVAVERLVELVVSKRNLTWSRARGGIEFGAGHYPFMVVLHTGLLAACLIGVTFLFTMVWLTDVRHPADPSLDVRSCYPKKPPSQHV